MRRRLRALILSSTTAFLLIGASANAAPPSVIEQSTSNLTSQSVTLRAKVDTGEKASKYRFEWGLSDCTGGGCTPTAEVQVPNKPTPLQVAAELSGLSPSTTYHFRVVIKNGEGEAKGSDQTFTTFPSDPVFGPCPNDDLRTADNPMAAFIEHLGENLPDCRAYEQASPVDKNGGNVKGMPVWMQASSDGDAVGFMGLAGIPGGDGAQELMPMFGSKQNGAWSTQHMLPPASAGEEAFVLGWAPDFSHLFSFARRLDLPKEGAVLSRSSLDRSLIEVAPYDIELEVAPYLAGTTADSSVVLFESKAKLTDEAIEGVSNVYAWERSSEELRLAAVMNNGQSPSEGAFAGPYDWPEGEEATDEGGAALNYYLQDQHALSDDASALYFTAAGQGGGEGAGQLYVRLNPTEPQSALDSEGECTEPDMACTLQVSASQKTNGKGPGFSDAAGTRPAAFMGASEDGSVAFLTSSEKLTNDANTGPEPEPPVIAQAPKDDGAPKDLEFLPATAAGLAVAGEFIYWADPENDAIGRAKLNGEDEDPDYVTGAENPQYVAVGPEHVYWTNPTDGTDGNGLIGRAKIGATEGEEVDQEYITGAHNPQGIAVNASHVFWANAGPNFDKLETRTIGRAKLGASEGEEVDQDFIQVDQGSQRYTPQGLAVDATHIYAAIDGTQANSYLFRYDLDGDPPNRVLVFDSQHLDLAGLRGIAIDSEFVYWARRGQDTIGRMKLADFDLESSERELEESWITSAGRPFGLAVSSTDIYWTANQEIVANKGNDLYRYKPGGEELVDITVSPVGDGADVQGVVGISADGSDLYFSANGILANGAAAGDCNGTISRTSINYSGQCTLYHWHDNGTAKGEITFVARLEAGGSFSDAANWLPHDAPVDRELEKTARVSPDGQTLLFRSKSQLTGYENEDKPALYRYDAASGEIGCISCSPTSPPTIAPGRVPTLGSVALSELPATTPAFRLSRNLSTDGNRVFFESTEALVGTDVNGEDGCPEEGFANSSYFTCQDVYMWEAEGTGSCEAGTQDGGCLYLLSSGESSDPSFFADASESGDDAFIVTSSRLVGQDQDQLFDVYDASVEGGLKSQNEPPPPSCETPDACQGPAPPQPSLDPPGSLNPPDPGNVKPKAKQRRCPKGKRKARVKGKVRCVPKRKGAKGKRTAKRAAKKSRRAGR
jgi:hypothetical protein